MATTTNFGWATPDDTDFVKDGAAAIRTLGSSIDTSLVDLQGGTTGQVLTKASGTDMDFIFVTPEIGDITAVVAGTGLSGGGTTGSVTLDIDSTVTTLTGTQTLTNKTLTSPALTTPTISTIDAKGDLLAGTADNTIGRRSIGANGTVLTADSAEATGMKWAAAAGGGKVLQVVQGTTSTAVSNSSSTLADTGLSATITPSATSSRILAIVSHGSNQKSSGAAGNVLQISLLRGSTNIATPTDRNLSTFPSNFDQNGTVSFAFLDSPATTSATTYKTQFSNPNNTSQVLVQWNSNISTIILMEIGA